MPNGIGTMGADIEALTNRVKSALTASALETANYRGSAHAERADKEEGRLVETEAALKIRLTPSA